MPLVAFAGPGLVNGGFYLLSGGDHAWLEHPPSGRGVSSWAPCFAYRYTGRSSVPMFIVPPMAEAETGLDDAVLEVAACEALVVGVTLESFPDDEPHPARASSNALARRPS